MSVVEDLKTLISFPTVSSRPVTELAAFLARRLQDEGLNVTRFDSPTEDGKCNVVATIGPPGTDGLVLSGHMDVVPTEGQPWSSDPFKLTERDGKLYGRGTADMKGFFAATLQALRRINPSEFKRELVLIWTHDEEVGCKGSAWLADHLLEEGRPWPTDCLIGEPTSFQILRMHPGHTALQAEFTGAAAHSSRPDLGANAIEAAARAVLAVQELAGQFQREPHMAEHFPRPWVAVNNATLHAGSAINIVPDHATLQVGYRPLPGMDEDLLFERFSEAIRGATDLPAHVHRLRRTPAMLTPSGTRLAQHLTPHAHDGPECATFATDGGNLARLGMRPLIFGPGSINVAHQADEFVPRDELEHAVDVIEAVIRQSCC